MLLNHLKGQNRFLSQPTFINVHDTVAKKNVKNVFMKNQRSVEFCLLSSGQKLQRMHPLIPHPLSSSNEKQNKIMTKEDEY